MIIIDNNDIIIPVFTLTYINYGLVYTDDGLLYKVIKEDSAISQNEYDKILRKYNRVRYITHNLISDLNLDITTSTESYITLLKRLKGFDWIYNTIVTDDKYPSMDIRTRFF